MDASIMDGRNLSCGAVGGVSGIKNPISLARVVMEKTPHVLMVGEGAMTLAQSNGIQLESHEYFHSDRRYEQWQLARSKNKTTLSEDLQSPIGKSRSTVGAVARDVHGNLSAATSTGGMTNKLVGRIGDSPIIGAGTYAKNSTCAVSATGHGEQFIRHAVAHSVSACMEYGGKSLKEASNHIVSSGAMLEEDDGGFIAIDKDGNIEMPFNSLGMFRGCITSLGHHDVKIWKDQ
eukprot:TRINITY_DN7250_c0_g1_i2.p1 TRINITY_DN7250_c0_g1~~TRINITY_DN7250_c0_g1_i2.p1  ORF type:complete len:233 (-),score=61.76 TRINITY_DN7250_c0_g1_i2:123-821(-)